MFVAPLQVKILSRFFFGNQIFEPLNFQTENCWGSSSKILPFLANKFYFSLHNSSSLGDQIIDYQYSLNQWFTLVVGCLLIFDIFYLKLNSSVFLFITIIAGIYFLLRLFGTILMLQNNFKYPILTVFVYLCTLEIVPALVIAKVLFVNS